MGGDKDIRRGYTKAYGQRQVSLEVDQWHGDWQIR